MSNILGRKVSGEGPASAKIMIVGEAPGKEEELSGRPFVGLAGQLLRSQLLAAGINPAECYITNVAKHRPPGNEIVRWFDPKSGIPSSPVISGIAELEEEISSVEPNVILALGNTALWALGGSAKSKWNPKRDTTSGLPHGLGGISDWRGSIFEGNELAGARKCVAAYHPAAVVRKHSWKYFLDLDLRRMAEQSRSSALPVIDRTICIDPQGEDRVQWRDRLLADPARIVFFDIEYINDRLLCCSFCSDSREVLVISANTTSDIAFIRSILESGHALGAQNGMFDCSVLEWHYGMKVMQHLKYDTMLASHSAYIELPKDLGTLCSIYTEQPCYWTHVNWKDIKAGKTAENSVYEYCGIDSWVTAEVARCQQADELQDPAVRKTFDFEMSLLAPLWEMSRLGVRVDADNLRKLKASLEAEIVSNSRMLDLVAGTELNVKSGPQMAKFLFETLGLPKGKTSVKTGKPSTDDKTLATLALKASTELQTYGISTVRAVRKARDLISKFCDIEFDSDGRYRSHYNPAGTDTGRLASRKFYPTGRGGNGQNLPRDKRVRKLYEPDRGHVFFYNDLERAESLVVAKITGDPLMLAHHRPDVDAHRLLAAELYEKPEDEVTSDERYMGKKTRHAGNYMQGWKTFMDNLNQESEKTGVSVSAAEAKRFIQRYRDLHPYLSVWWRQTEAQLQRTRRLYNLLGRPRQFFERLNQVLPAAVAFVPQSTVGDVLNVAFARCAADQELKDLGCQYMMQIHDALGGQVPEANVEPAMTRMRELMSVDLTVPDTGEVFAIPVEIAFGPSWGEVEVWKGDMAHAA